MTLRAVVTSNSGFPSVAGAQSLQVDDSTGLPQLPTSDSSGTPGGTTQSTPTGQAAFAIGQGTLIINNPLITTKSIVIAQLQSVDATLTFIKSVVPAAGNVTLNGNAAATAATKVAYVIFNS
jgi:hypothetical protein